MTRTAPAMSRFAPFAGLALLAVLGCTRDEAYLEVFREQKAAWKEMGDLLETVQDEKSMAEAKAVLEERGKRYAAISKKANSLPKPPPPEVLKQMQQDQFVVERTIARLMSETGRVGKLAGGEEFLKQFESQAHGLMSAVKR